MVSYIFPPCPPEPKEPNGGNKIEPKIKIKYFPIRPEYRFSQCRGEWLTIFLMLSEMSFPPFSFIFVGSRIQTSFLVCNFPCWRRLQIFETLELIFNINLNTIKLTSFGWLSLRRWHYNLQLTILKGKAKILFQIGKGLERRNIGSPISRKEGPASPLRGLWVTLLRMRRDTETK
jgi:hypothetical protein